MKKSILSAAIVASMGLPIANAADGFQYQIQIPLKETLSNWGEAAPIYHPWTNVGSHYKCETWNPDVNTVNYGQSFTQTRDCQQDQGRDVEIREKDSFSGIVKTVNTVQEQRTISETESQGATGTYRNWVSHTSTYTAWEDFGADYAHSVWSPAANSQTVDFSQSRNFKHEQERFEQKREIDTVTGDIRDNGEPVRHTQTDPRSQSRDVDVTVNAWSNVGGHYGCAAWAPLPEAVDVYEEYTQTRDCSQNQTRRWSYNADSTVIHARDEARTIKETESRAAEGTKRNWETTCLLYTSPSPRD